MALEHSFEDHYGAVHEKAYTRIQITKRKGFVTTQKFEPAVTEPVVDQDGNPTGETKIVKEEVAEKTEWLPIVRVYAFTFASEGVSKTHKHIQEKNFGDFTYDEVSELSMEEQAYEHLKNFDEFKNAIDV